MTRKTGLLTAIAILAMVMTSGCFEEFNSIPSKQPPVAEPTVSVVAYETQMPSMVPTTEYVLCSDYWRITDRYKTPKGFYIVAGNNTIPVTDVEYNRTRIDGFVNAIAPGTIDVGGAGLLYERFEWEIVDITDRLIPVTESESGYRQACKTIRST